VGYSGASVTQNMQLAEYLNCGAEGERSEFLGINDYSWCGESSFTLSGWDKVVQSYSNYSIPLFLSEYGCNTVPQRHFTEVEALYGKNMTPVFSGGLVYEYSMEVNNYGLVKINTYNKVTTLGDFDRLEAAFKKTPIPDNDGGYKKNGVPSKCPPQTNEWEASDNVPPMPDDAVRYLDNGAGKPLGNGIPDTNTYPPKTAGGGGPVTSGTSSTATASSSAESSTPSPSANYASTPLACRGNLLVAAVVVVADIVAGLVL